MNKLDYLKIAAMCAMIVVCVIYVMITAGNY